ncbi:MAG: transglycosylase domain-containing protein [Deltaproteobacteria bacterium]|nr:transglycosylase domain-containing protein [Deltaproteobacteria bacterium]
MVAIVAGGAIVAAPYVGRWYLQKRLRPRAERLLGRRISLGAIDLRSDRIAVRDVVIRGVADTKVPLLTLASVSSDFNWWAALRGRVSVARVVVHRPKISLRRLADGTDNFSDLLRRARTKKKKVASRVRAVSIGEVILREGTLAAVDDRLHVSLEAATFAGKIVLGQISRISLGDVHIVLPAPAPRRITFDRVEISGHLRRHVPRLEAIRVTGGSLSLLPRLKLSGIVGVVRPKLQAHRIDVDLSGSYGGARAKLWSAKGDLDPWARQGHLEVRAARFRLARIASILKKTPVILPEQTSIDGHLSLAYEDATLTFSGALSVMRLNLFYPALARTPVLDLSAHVDLAGEVKRTRVAIKRLDIRARGVEVKLTGEVDRLGGKPLIVAHLVMPKVACQRLLDAIPPSLVPKLNGFKLKGEIFADLAARIDYTHLAKLELGGKLPIYHCKVVEAPEEVSAERLGGPFDQSVELAPGQSKVFTVGPENPDFVPYEAISKHVIDAFLTTEDGAFFKHRGFIRSQFRAALARNLARGGFRLGASTITMQMVKNVLLSHEKTLSRKLQELILVWYLEQNLSKERIMEIYLNVIEFGPGIFGIGRAAQHYFAKPALDITPLEAAFFASILPSPRRRYVQYCHGSLSERWDRYVRRILHHMFVKGRVTKEEMEAAEKQQIIFNRDLAALSERDCKKEIKTLRKAWREAYLQRLKDAVLRAAPHQVDLYVPSE